MGNPPGKDVKILLIVENSKVTTVQSKDIRNAVKEAVLPLGKLDLSGKKVLIKPNCNSPDLYPGTTNPRVVLALIDLCYASGAGEVVVGDKSSIFWVSNTEGVMRKIGLWEAVEKAGARPFPFDKGVWVSVNPKRASYWRKGFKIPQVLKEADFVISVPVIHTHKLTGFSLSLKNSVGVIDGASRIKMHFGSHLQEKIAEINLAYEVDLVVLDGTRSFISGGPSSGELVEPHTIAASCSRVAADVAGYNLLVKWGASLPLPAESHPQISHAIKIGIK